MTDNDSLHTRLGFLRYDEHAYQRSKKQGDWRFYEMYERESRHPGNAPEPLFIETLTYRAKAEKYFEGGDYPAAVNYLRKYCEEQLKRLLPDNLLLKPKTNGEIEIEDLNGMIGKLENRFALFIISRLCSCLLYRYIVNGFLIPYPMMMHILQYIKQRFEEPWQKLTNKGDSRQH